MLEPVLLPCGHVAELKVIDSTRKCYTDGLEVNPLECININPSICHLFKEDKKWHVEIVDVLRKHLSKRAVYHLFCGTFYNESSIYEIYCDDQVKNFSDTELISALEGQSCKHCLEKFQGDIKLCSLEDVTENDKRFESLNEFIGYSFVRRDSRRQNGYVPIEDEDEDDIDM